jgi:hypothetical protein
MITPNDSTEGLSQESINTRCDDLANSYGQVYADQVFKAVVQQVNRYEALKRSKPNSKEVRAFLSQANYKHPHKRDAFQTVISYKGTPIIDVEFSDYFYIKLVQLTTV